MSCCFGELLFLIESPEQVLQVSSGEAPIERHRGLLVAALEADQPPLDLNEIQEVVGGQDLALHDREVDLDLVQPGGRVRNGSAGRTLLGPMRSAPRGGRIERRQDLARRGLDHETDDHRAGFR